MGWTTDLKQRIVIIATTQKLKGITSILGIQVMLIRPPQARSVPKMVDLIPPMLSARLNFRALP